MSLVLWTCSQAVKDWTNFNRRLQFSSASFLSFFTILGTKKIIWPPRPTEFDPLSKSRSGFSFDQIQIWNHFLFVGRVRIQNMNKSRIIYGNQFQKTSFLILDNSCTILSFLGSKFWFSFISQFLSLLDKLIISNNFYLIL